MTEAIRLAKRVAELRACSRREAEQLITGGWVRVNGQVVESPQHRVADETIEIDATANAAQAEAVTVLLHKPADQESPAPERANWWAEDASGMPTLNIHFTRQTACAPLETRASGLVVFSQDWRIVRKLTEDAATVEHEFVVEVAGDLAASKSPEGLQRLNRGVSFNGRTSTSLKISWQNESRLRIALKGAQAGLIAKLCESVGLQILSMKRIRLGGVAMGKLPAGQWRYFRADERF